MAVSHRPCRYIGVYTDVAAVLLQLYWWGDFYSLIFKTEHKLGTVSGTAAHLPLKNYECAPVHF
jgi:hypothetical protein